MKLKLTFSFSYLFDYLFTGVMLLTNSGWVDLAHYVFIPFIGVHGYLVLRLFLFLLTLWSFQLARDEPRALLVLKALTAFYIAVCIYNVISYLIFF